jgi:hypothetical protein
LLALDESGDSFSIDMTIKPMHSARPLDKQFCIRWDKIAYSASNRAQTIDTQSIVRDFVAANFERQKNLLRMGTYDGRKIVDAVFSWRYAVMVTSPTDSDDPRAKC